MKYDEKLLDVLTDKTNRKLVQTKFLLDLLDGDMRKLVDLEVQLRNTFTSYCPGDLEEIEKVMILEPKSDYFDVLFLEDKVVMNEEYKKELSEDRPMNENTTMTINSKEHVDEFKDQVGKVIELYDDDFVDVRWETGLRYMYRVKDLKKV